MVGKGFFEQAIKVAKQAAGQGKQVAKELAVRELIRKTWDAQTLQGLLAGKVVITDEMVNSYLEERAKDQPDSGRLQVHFTEEHLEITSDTQSWGQVIVKGQLVSLHHNRNSSVLVVAVIDRQMPDKKLLSWAVSWISLSFLSRLFGPLKLGAGMQVEISGNIVTVDFTERLRQSTPKRFEVYGYNLLDVVQVTGAVVKIGAVEINCRLEVGESMRKMMNSLIAFNQYKKPV